MDEPKAPKATGKRFRVCSDCYDTLERYAADLRNTLSGKQIVAEEAFAAAAPPAPVLCPRCQTAMAELKQIHIASRDTDFKLGT